RQFFSCIVAAREGGPVATDAHIPSDGDGLMHRHGPDPPHTRTAPAPHPHPHPHPHPRRPAQRTRALTQ
ncbi:hypothetical protein ACWC3X_37895, partial [Streptomyces populi]